MKRIIIAICMLFLIQLVLAQSNSGGGSRELTQEEFYEMSDDSTKCLIDNCDYFCKQYGLEIGYYYEKDKCWCESYITTEYGQIKSDDGWIEIKECSQELINIKEEQDVSSYKNITRQRDVLVVVVSIFFFIIIVLGVIYRLRKK